MLLGHCKIYSYCRKSSMLHPFYGLYLFIEIIYHDFNSYHYIVSLAYVYTSKNILVEIPNRIYLRSAYPILLLLTNQLLPSFKFHGTISIYGFC